MKKGFLFFISLLFIFFITGCSKPEQQNEKSSTEKVAQKDAGASEKVQEPMKEAVAEPTKEAVAEPMKEAVTEPTKEAVAEPMKEAVAEPSLDGGAEALPEAVAEQVAETLPEPRKTNVPNPAAEAQIKAVKGGSMGNIQEVAVTYIKQKIGSDVAGFFVQATKQGPALFIAVDPASIKNHKLQVGDIISFKVKKAALNHQGRFEVTELDGPIIINGSGYDVTKLSQDVSKEDIVSKLDDYESELIVIEGTLTRDFVIPAGGGFVAASVTTQGVPKGSLILRIPKPTSGPSIADKLGLVKGCKFSVSHTPLWRYKQVAQISAFNTKELKVISCPAPVVTKAFATSPTQVIVRFSQELDATSVMTNGAQFTFDNGLTATAAKVQGNEVELTTSKQDSTKTYTLTVATTIKSKIGQHLDSKGQKTTFKGYSALPKLIINEINPSISKSCDLIELRVVEGGNLDGFTVQERTYNPPLVTFKGLTVKKNDIIIIHLNGKNSTCNPSGAQNETTGLKQFPKSAHANNFDTAYDWYSTDTGLTGTNNIITIYDPNGKVVDVALWVENSKTGVSSSTVSQANKISKSKQWTDPQGKLPAGGYSKTNIASFAIPGRAGSSVTGNSYQRKSNKDTNSKDDWTVAKPTWGVKNAGQSDY